MIQAVHRRARQELSMASPGILRFRRRKNRRLCLAAHPRAGTHPAPANFARCNTCTNVHNTMQTIRLEALEMGDAGEGYR